MADPLSMRTADPKNPGSWNTYTYVQADPINSVDPRGLNMCEMLKDASTCETLYGSLTAGGGGNCTVDGVWTPCDMAGRMQETGAALTYEQYNQWLFTVSKPPSSPGVNQAQRTTDIKNAISAAL